MGAASLVWGGFWIYLVYDSPEVHPRIDKEELKYLQESIGVVQIKVSIGSFEFSFSEIGLTADFDLYSIHRTNRFHGKRCGLQCHFGPS